MNEIQQKIPTNIFSRVLGVMSDLAYIQKGSKVSNLYSFVSHDQVTSKIHPLLVKWGIAVIPTVEELKQEGNRTVAKIKVIFINADNPTDCFNVNYFGYGIDSSDKGPGKAVSYAYKYALLKTFCLETGDDPDEDQQTVYEPARCLDFDLKIPVDMNQEERLNLYEFLEYSASVMKKHIEEVKLEASEHMNEFLSAFRNWEKRKCNTI